ncbi:c-type cytochrome [Sphingobium sp.]|uniref:c-type cytochrome n=1 Tax=Sphingobium sp. TaxID=1912891 RepID=UPI0028BF273E|nr:c-type cytochrome [Sphingobium sp.]
MKSIAKFTFFASVISITSVYSSALSASDPASGAATFAQRCQACHSLTPGQKGTIGPNLSNIANRAAASTAFSYSAALKAARLRWDANTLNLFLAAPNKVVPGTRMNLSVTDVKKRADLIAYLMTFK